MDTGMLASIDWDVMIQIENVQVYAGYVIHSGQLLSGSVCLGEHVKLSVDFERRLKIASTHTMTHILNFAFCDMFLFCIPKKARKVMLCSS